MENLIEIAGLRKSYGRHRALDGIDLTVRAGQVHGLLGSHGAGKTTILRILLGLIRADAGTVRLFGGDPWRDAARLHRRLAYVPADVMLWPGLSGGEAIDLLGRLGGGLDPQRRSSLIERLELDPARKARAYSRADRQKAGLVAAFASGAELLVLDEPAAGLGPALEATLGDLVREARASGRTVLLASRLISEVEAVCDETGIVRDGKILDAGALAEFRRGMTTSIDARLADPGHAVGLSALPGVHGVDVLDGKVHCRVEATGLGDVLRLLASAGIRSLVSRPLTLEEQFLRPGDTAAAGPAARTGHEAARAGRVPG